MSWSYSALVREHGEERALELLADKTGYGDFGRYEPNLPTDGPTERNIPARCPLCGEAWSSRRPCGPGPA